MKVVIFSDCHWNASTPVDVIKEFGSNVYYIGDNFEFKNIPKDRIGLYKNRYLDFLTHCYETDTKVLNGNHEVSIGKNYNNVETIFLDINEVRLSDTERVAFEHGDIAMEGHDYHERWLNKKPGKSWHVRFGIYLKNKIRNKRGATKLSKKKIFKLVARAKLLKVDVIIIGHTHPKRVIDETHSGIRIINVPRGKTVLYL